MKNNSILQLLASMFLLFLIIAACNKQQNTAEPPHLQIPAILQLSDSADSRLITLIKEIQKKQYQTAYLLGLEDKYGMPLWEKGLIGQRNSTTVYTIPLKLSGASKISGFIAFELGDSLQYQLYPNVDVNYYGYSRKKGAANGVKVKNLMMALNARTTGENNPIEPPLDCIERKYLENARIADNHGKVTINTKIFVVESCYSWWVCIADAEGNCITEKVYHQDCVSQTYWISDEWESGGVGGEGPGSGGSGSEGGGGNGAGSNPGGGGSGLPGSCDNVPLPDELPEIDDAQMALIPCKSSFNLVRDPVDTWQAAVISDYRFGFHNPTRSSSIFEVNVGTVEVGLPRQTYAGDIIHASEAGDILTDAAKSAERTINRAIALYVMANPNAMPHNFNDDTFVAMFKNAWQYEIDIRLRKKYYQNQYVSPSRVSTDVSSFTVKDPTLWRTLKFWGRDC
ncbi:hypothetical protein [Chitinophaga barathri]|uniref:Uncharacterized protein n=1 Tax=Chitinophaga barathri TaxID=1647451 RepID=A0A3N4MIB8_9BACT|nr:hypothetical protein [Chitinophaga barathri]RPD39810.1 hypothetical protein EG028_16895 [Chitinophaga barathri]